MTTLLGAGLVRSSVVKAGEGSMLLLAVQPDPAATSLDDQAASLYVEARGALRAHAMDMSDVAIERLFVGYGAIQGARWRAIRHEVAPDSAPMTLIGQPPADRGHLCEMQLLAIRGTRTPAPAHDGQVSRFRIAGARVVLVSTAATPPGAGTSARREVEEMFLQAERTLAREGLSFHHVVRTWIFLHDIDRDYGALNAARRSFFAARGVQAPPASTGIGGVPEQGRRCSMDLMAVAWDDGRRPEMMHARTMNEAPSYGADFSRGTRLALDGRTLLLVSGTASIDPAGQVAHVGDIDRQARCMLDNVTNLLAQQGVGSTALVQAVTYLKKPSYLGALREALAEKGYPPRIPHTVCVADVCRPAWLCEMEGLAVV